MNIKGKLVTLRAIEREDIPLMQKWGNDPDISYMVGGWHFPTNINDTSKWFETLTLKSLDQRFAIQTEEYGVIGTATLVGINWKDRNATYGVLIGDKNLRGKGYAMDTMMAVLRYAFEELGMNRLDCSVIEYNKASYNLLVNKCVWKLEGTQREWFFRKNRYWDRLLVGITKKDYLEFLEQSKYWNE